MLLVPPVFSGVKRTVHKDDGIKILDPFWSLKENAFYEHYCIFLNIQLFLDDTIRMFIVKRNVEKKMW
ncbi:hypothetical protein ASG66_10250 [Bacillus sp. Leaf406]|nr:hypothetical protein ASG66_10250 [Bacillus sp. Leaf406]